MNLGVGLTFGAGLASFLSPCVLPLVPTYLLYLAGEEGGKRRVILRAVAFILGFSLIFVSMGLTSTILGQFLRFNHVPLGKVAGILMVLMGLFLVVPIPFLQGEKRLGLLPRGGLGGAFLLGLVFAVGWTPCVGPVLAGVLALASQTAHFWDGGWLLLIYAAGLATPFILCAFFLEGALPLLRRLGPFTSAVKAGTGVLLAFLGVMMYLGEFARLSAYFPNWGF